MKYIANVDPNRNFNGEVFGADDILKHFPDIRPDEPGVYLEQCSEDPDLFYILTDDFKRVHDTAFFSTEEMKHLIITDLEGIIVRDFNDPDGHPDIAEIPGVIRRGSKVVDTNGNIGIVVRINTWGREFKDLDDEHHGELEVWRQDDCNYGANNCEHYTLTSFGDFLTVLEY